MHLLCESEIKVLNAIVRKTYGWHKEKDKISLSQMQKLTGLSRQACQDGKDGLIKKGIIKAEIVDGITEYMVIEPDQSKTTTSLVGDKPGLLEPKKVVYQVDTQKKELQNKSTKENNQESQKPPQLRRDNDPFAIPYDFEKSNIIYDEIEKHFIKEYKTKPKPDKLACNDIASRLVVETEEEIREEIRNKIQCFIFDPYWREARPNPKLLSKAWDQLDEKNIPKHLREKTIETKTVIDTDIPEGQFEEIPELTEQERMENLKQLNKMLEGLK